MYSFINNDRNAEINSLNNNKITMVHSYGSFPKSSLGYTTNNQYTDFPPLMADGRALIASWQSQTLINDNLLKENNIQSNWEYRRYLSQNAEAIMRQNFIEAANDMGYYERMNRDMQSNYSPIGDQSRFSTYNSPSMVSSAQSAIVNNSDLKELYLSREELEKKRELPFITQDELLRILPRR